MAQPDVNSYEATLAREILGMHAAACPMPAAAVLLARAILEDQPSGPSDQAVLPGKLAHQVYAGTYTAGWNDYIDAVNEVGPMPDGNGSPDYVKGWNACRAAHHSSTATNCLGAPHNE
jgi:hypothetical protein